MIDLEISCFTRCVKVIRFNALIIDIQYLKNRASEWPTATEGLSGPLLDPFQRALAMDCRQRARLLGDCTLVHLGCRVSWKVHRIWLEQVWTRFWTIDNLSMKATATVHTHRSLSQDQTCSDNGMITIEKVLKTSLIFLPCIWDLFGYTVL